MSNEVPGLDPGASSQGLNEIDIDDKETYFKGNEMTTELKRLYDNRELIIFTEGEEYFNQQANKFFKNKGLKYPNQNNEYESLFDVDFYRCMWEFDNGYHTEQLGYMIMENENE